MRTSQTNPGGSSGDESDLALKLVVDHSLLLILSVVLYLVITPIESGQ
jgi:hypothetical protein